MGCPERLSYSYSLEVISEASVREADTFLIRLLTTLATFVNLE